MSDVVLGEKSKAVGHFVTYIEIFVHQIRPCLQAGRVTLVRPVPIVLVKCWKVAHWNAKKLLKNCQKSKKLLPKFQKLLPKFLAIFIQTLTESFIFRSSQ